jgi:hypothetical protein
VKHYLSIVSIVCLFTALVVVVSTAQNQPNSTTSSSSQVSVPHLVKFSGTVKDDAGHPRSGVVGITFALYKDQQNGAPLWLETQNVQADSKGNYTVLLGSSQAEGLPTDIFSSNDARWLGVRVEGQEEQPRTLLVSAPYALKAGDAETLGGKPISAFQLVAPQSGNGSAQTPVPAAEQANEIICASGTACKSAFIPLFTTNGGSAKVSDSIITQVGASVNVAGEVLGKTGFFLSSNNGAIFQATQTSNTTGTAVAGVAEGSSGVGVEGSGVTGVSGFGLSNGTGVAGQGGTGVFGFSSPTTGFARATVGVLNTNASGSAAVYGIGQNSSGQTYGVQGYNFSNTNFASGVSGVADGDQNKTFGVTGVSLSPNGTGLWGLGQGQSVTGGIVGCCSVGVWGDTSSNAPFAAGVVGTADDAQGVVALNNSTNSDHPTLKVINFENTAHDVTVLTASGSFGSCTSDTDGNLHCTGTITPTVSIANGAKQVALYSMASPQNWFEDFGSGQLSGGASTVALDPAFAETIAANSEYHVFLTPEGECRGLYISHKTANSFQVHELGGGQSNVSFAYRIVALRRGYENVRLEDKTTMMAKMKDNMPKPSATPAERWTPPVRPKPFTATAIPANHVAVVPTKSAPGSSPN